MIPKQRQIRNADNAHQHNLSTTQGIIESESGTAMDLKPLEKHMNDMSRIIRKRSNSAAEKVDSKLGDRSSLESNARQSQTLSAKLQAGRVRPSKIPRRMVRSEKQDNAQLGDSQPLVKTVVLNNGVLTSMESTILFDDVPPDSLDFPPKPVPPVLSIDTQIYPYGLSLIQNYINEFGYNHTSVPFYRMKKTGGTHHLLDIVRQIQELSLPIQCVEAVFIATVLSSVWTDVVRIPLSFKSKIENSTHRHIVLAIYYNGKWGSLGISRRSCLMDKALEYDSLWNLIMDFSSAYESVYHRLLSVYVGLPMPHDLEHEQPLTWKAIKLRIEKSEEDANQFEIHKYMRRHLTSSVISAPRKVKRTANP